MFTEDLSPFFSTADFASTALWSVGPAAVEVIFDNEYFETLSTAGRQPVAWVRDAQLPTVATGQTLTINGTAYTIVGIEPDGTGVTMLRLQG